jgi:hypothetical protein
MLEIPVSLTWHISRNK